MGISDTLEKELVQRILTAAKPDRIILFGSAAVSKMNPGSDIDLLVIEEEPGNTRHESVRIRRMLDGIGYPIDVIVMSARRFDETKNIFGGIAYPAHKYGRVIYEAA